MEKLSRSFFFMLFGLLLPCFSHAETSHLILKCTTTILRPDDDKSVLFKIEIKTSDEANALIAQVNQTVDGVISSSVETVKVTEGAIREGLAPEKDYTDLNMAEQLVLHAMALQDPIFEGKYSSGIDLSKVRAAKAYIIGEQTDMGTIAIIVAKNAKAETLGSFLGGFLVGACK